MTMNKRKGGGSKKNAASEAVTTKDTKMLNGGSTASQMVLAPRTYGLGLPAQAEDIDDELTLPGRIPSAPTAPFRGQRRKLAKPTSAPIHRATMAVERVPVAAARPRRRARPEQLEDYDFAPDVHIKLQNVWEARVFVALAERHGLDWFCPPRGQRTTVMVRIFKRDLDEILWPEFMAIVTLLRASFDKVTDRIIAEKVPR